MADRSQPWGDRTAEVPPAADPWAPAGPSWPDTGPSWPDSGSSWPDAGQTWPDRGAQPSPPRPAYQRGVAQVGQSGRTPIRRDDTYAGGPDWTAVDRPADAPRPPVRYQLRQLRRGGEWTTIGGLFAFVCWGIWMVSIRGGDVATPVLTFVLVLLVAGGVFALSRLLGRVIIERALHRTRRTAWPSHLLTGLFLAAAGVAYLKQTQWVVDAWNFVTSL